jgi:hypothetical protein
MSSSTTTTTTATTSIFMSAMEDIEIDENTRSDQKPIIDLERTWNLGELRKEVSRLTVRCHKKIGKATQRLQKAQEEVNRLTSTDDVSMEELEACPNIDELSNQVDELQYRLKQLNQLEVLLQDMKGKKVVLPDHVAQLAFDLQVNDEPTPQNNNTQDRPQKKQKGPKTMSSFRLPYRRYFTSNKTEIRVSCNNKN